MMRFPHPLHRSTGRRPVAAAVLVGALAAGLGAGLSPAAALPGAGAPATDTTGGSAATTTATTDPAAQHVFVVMMENADWSSVKGDARFPYVNGTLLPEFASATDYRSGLHPSLPNYVELEAGASEGLTNGSYLPTDHTVATSAHLTTQLRAANLGWKYYAENLPGNGTTCNLTDPGTPYSEDHNPFVYFTDVQSDPAYCIQHERPYSELASDLSAGTVPQYSFIVPNDWDQGEKPAPGSSCTRCQADAFLSTEIPRIQASSAYQHNGVILVLWDESAGTDTNPSGLIVVSKLAKRGYQGAVPYSHGSTLRTVQEMFGLTPLLGDAATATDLADLFTTPPFASTTAQPGAPQAAFTADPVSGAAPLPVALTDTSTGSPTSWSWDFGDGGTSTVQDPSHTYATAGTYPVTLTATNATGSSTARTTVTASTAPQPIASPKEPPSRAAPSASSASGAATTDGWFRALRAPAG
ncbi:PKD domain-containing protein [Amnibacterium sp. CER49]|uniref:PKD domain-containing protein n=1 Tax=Amnibacterium sp. CER49 TaxID=3039161 RepID=UPI00244924B0|nr:PKD domain-containing protein [Amnibacterium sp. CER49]MDH2445425.1 PKD domain-containing protein [Amnibacterium sp. CER49]